MLRVCDYYNSTTILFAGLQVDGSPPAEDFPPSHHDLAIFKDVDYYGIKNTAGKTQHEKKGGKKRKNSESSPQKDNYSK